MKSPNSLCTKSWISLCYPCVLCVSVVVFSNNSSTTEAQRTQRLHREDVRLDFSCKAPTGRALEVKDLTNVMVTTMYREPRSHHAFASHKPLTLMDHQTKQ